MYRKGPVIHDISENLTESGFFVSYIGSSMKPTLREPEMMEISPYGSRPVPVGDVVFFSPPGNGQPVVHRVVRVTPAGIVTRGDNSVREDPYLLQPHEIKGRVIAAWRGQKRRNISGGLQGRLTGYFLRSRNIIDRGISGLLRNPYRLLSRTGLIAGLLPTTLRPRVVVFRNDGQDQFRLLLRHRVIGRFDERSDQWHIERPFRLLINERKLPRQRTSDSSLYQGPCYKLDLADGSHWAIAAANEEAVSVVSQLCGAMKLRLTSPSVLPRQGIARRLLVSVSSSNPETLPSACYLPLKPGDSGSIACPMIPHKNNDELYERFMQLSSVIACETQVRGGVLLHGALAEYNGMGVILAAGGGTGKSTASKRLISPWHSLCDDTTLVVRDVLGNYWAHPWPTWSRFLWGGPGGRWDVQHAVPLKAIFCLAQSIENRAEPLGAGNAVSLLVRYAEQASIIMARALGKEGTRKLRLEQFDNLCALARVVPAHLLHISLIGDFWCEMERALEETGKRHEVCV